jgi:hypothetical protein
MLRECEKEALEGLANAQNDVVGVASKAYIGTHHKELVVVA